MLIELEAEHVTEVFSGFGQINVRAEDVATHVLDEARRYLAAGVPVGEHLADQLLLPLGIGATWAPAAGRFARWPSRSTPRRTSRFCIAFSKSTSRSSKPAGMMWSCELGSFTVSERPCGCSQGST